uniref:Uncharacterized protein n=1 Tax=Manihot esculenta TaxID=3983 RepID=A0A2C9VVJ3_MANES
MVLIPLLTPINFSVAPVRWHNIPKNPTHIFRMHVMTLEVRHLCGSNENASRTLSTKHRFESVPVICSN